MAALEPSKPQATLQALDGEIAVCILAGGLSTRMGRPKSSLQWRGRTFLSHLKHAAAEAGWPCRIIAHDQVPRCGPLGGIATGLLTSRQTWVVFLACDMPLIHAALLQRMVRRIGPGSKPRVVRHQGTVGFPIVLPAKMGRRVLELIQEGVRSVQELSRRTGAVEVPLPKAWMFRLANINTPEDLKRLAGSGNSAGTD
ncbi:MAG: molybdenum cofactor guanylyltransferase [Verrucomicrobia bacterium]|nr:molybdenum cofactor guanylyltransferase [Verrucomicrobiota bacterium]